MFKESNLTASAIMTSLLMTKQLNPDDRIRALLRGPYVNSPEDGSVSNHIKKAVQKVVCGLVDYIHVNQISFRRQYIF
jgi:hypothetical protein